MWGYIYRESKIINLFTNMMKNKFEISLKELIYPITTLLKKNSNHKSSWLNFSPFFFFFLPFGTFFYYTF